MSKLSSNSAQPLYLQLMMTIKNQIDEGTLKPGSKLMNESELEETYGVSRITVRRALKELTDEGVLERKRGKGTFIKKNKITRELIAVDGFTDFIKRLGKQPSTQILSTLTEPATEEQAKELKVYEGDDLYFLKRLLFVEEDAIALDMTHYPLKRFPNFHKHIYDYSSTYEMLQEVYNIEIGKNKKILSVESAGSEESSLLNCDIGTPLYSFKKVLYDQNGSPIHLSNYKLSTEHFSFYIEG